MHSYLITGGSYENRTQKEAELCRSWHVQPFDMFRLSIPETKQSIGIEEIRLLIQNLSLSPRTSPLVVGIIDASDALTTEAQNALLKTLEEPPPRARIILEIENSTLLLPTIISRCQIIHLDTPSYIPDEEKTKILTDLQSYEEKKPGEIVHTVTSLFATKEDGERYLNTLLQILHETLHTLPINAPSNTSSRWNTQRLVRIIQRAMLAKKYLVQHTNHLLVFDNFFQNLSLDKE